MAEEITHPLADNVIGQALSANSEAHPALKGLSGLTIGRQLGLMLGLALSVAVGVAVVLWSQMPTYGLLFPEMSEKDAAEIAQILETQGVKYKIEPGSGAIRVPADQVNDLKFKLAAQGLPKTAGIGYEILDKEKNFGDSKNVEMIRFRRALEGEIAQTIMSIQNVKSAKVLLALPQQSLFIRERKKPSASVMINLYQGRALDKGQIESIVHLVASSVPQLETDQITVVDQRGNLLNSKDSGSEGGLSIKQFEYKKNIEDHLMARIENILSPLVGEGMRAQVSADFDFSQTDRTQEIFNPDLPALRSEQTSEQKNSLSAVQGIPGALSNQPTPAGTAPETLPNAQNAPGTPATGAPQAGATAEAGAGNQGSANKSATRNYELDKTITHTRMATGTLRRLSVAVVIDDKHVSQADGALKTQPYSQEDINRFSDLVRQAVGFDSNRGDQVTVTNVAFQLPSEIEALPEPPFWEQGWFLDLIKQIAAAVVVLLLLLGVLRPTMRILAGRDIQEKQMRMMEAEAKAAESAAHYTNERGIPVAVPAGMDAGQQGSLEKFQLDDLLLLEAPQSYERRLEYVQRLVDEDAKLVAQVIKTWAK
ncbi:MAG: flagellar M-ring protein FliF [Methylobacter sp.]|nr:MAG: flagellar M-ring protein FliF [Methylobacter sp.]PPD04382.1 MAG: flagellar M-ring protein FliF [Methylobacter sp.]PPD37436.1 MAG: flagellar M-ring protein FliF [Methylomonas sp.]